MKDFTSKIPLPITALSLSWVLLGNVFQSSIPFLSDFCMVVSVILLILSVLRIIRHPKSFFEFIKTSSGLALFSSFSLSLIMISVWMKGVFGKANIYIWVAGVILHTLIFIIFTWKYVTNLKETKINPTWFLIYSGLGMSIVTCRDFGMIIFGKFMFNLILYISIALIPLVVLSIIINRRNEKQSFRPYFSLITLPLGILIPAYISTYLNVNTNMLIYAFYLLQILFVIVLLSMFLQIFNGFFPSWSSYSLGTSVMIYGVNEINNYMVSHNSEIKYMDIVVNFEYVIVFLICLLVLLAYLINISEGEHFVTEKLNLESREKLKKARDIVSISKTHELDKKREERLRKREERRNREIKKRRVDENYIKELRENVKRKNFDESPQVEVKELSPKEKQEISNLID